MGFGYDAKDGELVINEEEAQWVRWIFAQAMSGKTSGWIARELNDRNAKKGFDDLAEEIETLRSEKEALLLEDANRVGMQQRLDELEAFLEEHQEPVTDYDEGLVRKLIERITVYDGYLAFEFKSGLETEVQM